MRNLRLGLLVVLVVLVAGLMVWSADASPWPRFRGPNGTGVALDKDIPVEWNQQSGILWKTPIPGVGNSSPIVWGDHVFLQSSTPDARQRMLLCVRAKDGKTLWTKSVKGDRAKIHAKSSFASGTPATDGERVYVIFWDGASLAMHAFDFQGNEVWKRDLGPFSSQHGAGHSPMIFEDKVIFANDQDDSATVVALDAKSGKPAWQTPRKAFRACYSTPFLLEKAGEPTELIVASTAGVTSYDPHTGTENWNWVWQHARMPLRTVASPIYQDGLIFVTSGDGGGDRHMVAIKTGTKGSVESGVVWENNRAFPYVPTMLTRGEHLYAVNDRGAASCYVARTGENVYTERIGGNVFASPILIDGKIYACSEEGDVYVYPAAPTFKLLAKNSMGEPIMATPAVADNRLFIRGQSHLFCVGKKGAK